jgi:hypothetical protein
MFTLIEFLRAYPNIASYGSLADYLEEGNRIPQLEEQFNAVVQVISTCWCGHWSNMKSKYFKGKTMLQVIRSGIAMPPRKRKHNKQGRLLGQQTWELSEKNICDQIRRYREQLKEIVARFWKV